jgi:hypothetical protein
VNQSTDKRLDDRAVLLQHGSELADFAELLTELGIEIESRGDGLPSLEDLEGARLVVALGKRLVENKTLNLGLWPRTIAVVDDSSRTLVSQLNRIGVSMIVRRPIHTRALRLLLLHQIYRGPEKRGRKRILIGHPIRVGKGLFKSRAMLLELSPTGARIDMKRSPQVGTPLRILLGKEITQTKPLKLQATVVRCTRSTVGSGRNTWEVGVSLARSSANVVAIKGILERFASGPASCKDGRPSPVAEAARAPSGARTMAGTSNARALPPSHVRPAAGGVPELADLECGMVSSEQTETRSECPADAATGPETGLGRGAHESTAEAEGPQDRRATTRVPYDRRVVALGEEAARVLVGRDLSPGGMRIDATSSVAFGDLLRVALHSGNQSEPIIVLAHVLRDDGDDGLVLGFRDLSPRQQEQLEQIIDSSGPIHLNRDPSDEEDISPFPAGSIVVAEMLDTVGREIGDTALLGGAEGDSFVDASKPVEDAR